MHHNVNTQCRGISRGTAFCKELTCGSDSAGCSDSADSAGSADCSGSGFCSDCSADSDYGFPCSDPP